MDNKAGFGVSGRRASDARRVVSLGSIAYLGSHGSEILHPGSIAPEMDRELQAWTRRVQNFAREAYSESLRKLRVRLEDKEAIAALHWRDVPDEEEAERGVREVAVLLDRQVQVLDASVDVKDAVSGAQARDHGAPGGGDTPVVRHDVAAALRRL